MFGPRIVFLLLIPSIMSPFAAGQCCDVPPVHIMNDSMVLVSNREVWTTDVFVNGTLVVDGELLITGAEVVLGGAGISVTENGTLMVRDSRISPHPNNTGFYLENRGRLELDGTVLDRCSDPDNSLIGVYQVSSSLIMNGSMMVRSGLINCQRSSVSIRESSISGLVSSESDCIVKGGNVTSMGLTQYGKGRMEVMDVHVTSSIPFSSPISAISSLDGGELVLEDVRIDGSYDGGIYSRNGRLSINTVTISLQDGLYGLRSENTTFDRLEELDIEGSLEGMTLLGASSDTHAKDCIVRANYTGLVYDGAGTMTAESCKFEVSTYGAIVKGPTFFQSCSFKDNLIGLMAEDGSLKDVRSCEFIRFTKWGIEEESWTPKEHHGNVFVPSGSAIGPLSWWGRVNVSVRSDRGFEIEGAELELTTIGEDPVRISDGEIGMVWGYGTDDGGTITFDSVIISARWGTAHERVSIKPWEVRSITLTLKLSDLNVTGISRRGSVIDVEVTLMGPEVRDARITLYVDGSYRTSELFELGPNGTSTFSFPLSGLKEGEREVTARVLSRDEYSGPDGTLQGNNELSLTFTIKEDGGRDASYILLGLCILFVSIAALVLVGYVKKEGPKV